MGKQVNAMGLFGDEDFKPEENTETETVTEPVKRGVGALPKGRTHKIAVYLTPEDYTELGLRKTQANKHSKKRLTMNDIVNDALKLYFKMESNQSQ